jgi:chromosome segregation ATPase
MSLSDRFKRLPDEQALRFEESKSQAHNASALLTRLRATRQEAERLALDEINHTKAMQREEVEQHPQVQELKRRLRAAEAARDDWSRKAAGQQGVKQQEVERLRGQEDQLMRRFNDAKEAEMRQQAQFEEELQVRAADEARFESLQSEFNNLKGQEEYQFVQAANYAQSALNDAERDLTHYKTTHPEPESLRADLKRIDAQVIKEQQELDSTRSNQLDLESKRDEAQRELNKAENLFEDSREQERTCQEQLERLKASIGDEQVGKIVQEAEQVRFQLQNVKRQCEQDIKVQNERIAAAEPKLSSVRNEIRRLMEEEAEQLKDLNESYVQLKQAQNESVRIENDLKTAEMRCRDAQQLSKQAEARRTDKAEQVKQLQTQYYRLSRAHHEAGAEVAKARDLIAVIEQEMLSRDKFIAEKERKLSDLSKSAEELSDKLMQASRLDALKAKVDEKRDAAADINARWLQWKQERLQPLLNEMNRLESKLRTAPLKAPAPVSKQTDSLWREIEAVRDRISAVQREISAPPVNFENPDTLYAQLQQKEAEVRGRLMSRTSPASPRFTRQLEREAEAILRAEAAASLERKQEAIERDASALSSIRIEKNPHFSLDEEAKARLWSLNEEDTESGAIAQTVLDLVQSKNISVREA